MLSLFKKVLCNFVPFIKTHPTIYKNSIMWKRCFHRGFKFFLKKKKIIIYKKSGGSHQVKKSVKTWA